MNTAPLPDNQVGIPLPIKTAATILKGIVSAKPKVATVGDVHFNATAQRVSDKTLSNKPFNAISTNVLALIEARFSTFVAHNTRTMGAHTTQPMAPK